jgi:hypothetical protein
MKSRLTLYPEETAAKAKNSALTGQSWSCKEKTCLAQLSISQLNTTQLQPAADIISPHLNSVACRITQCCVVLQIHVANALRT